MALEILNDPFASEATISIDESMIRDASPSMPDTKAQDLIRAANNEKFDKQEGINEKFLLDKEVVSIASTISAELGPFALDVYESSQKLIQAGALKVLNEGDRTGSFRGGNARGGSQWDVQQLDVRALDDAASASDRVYSTGGSGNFNIAPGSEDRDPSNDDTSNVGNNNDGTESLNTDTQNVFILGFYASTNPRVVEQVQIEVDDGEDRTAFDAFGHQNLGTLQAFDAPSVEYINDDDSFDINGTATSDSTTDFYPFGLNFDTAANLNSLNTKA